MNDDAIGDEAPLGGIVIVRGVEDLGIDATDAALGVAGLDGPVGILGDSHAAHGEEAGRGLGMSGAEAAFAGAAAEGLLDLAGLKGDHVHALCSGIDDVEPLRIVGGMAGRFLGGDEGLDGIPVHPSLSDGRCGRLPGGARLQKKKSEERGEDPEARDHGRGWHESGLLGRSGFRVRGHLLGSFF